MKRTISFLIATLFFFELNIAQLTDIYCPDIATSGRVQLGGQHKPASHAPGEYFRILIVFAEFANDTYNYSDWEYGELPDYSNILIADEVSASYQTMSMSEYWKEMSMGNYDVIGDIYPAVIRLNSEDYYRLNGKNYEDVNREVIATLDFAGFDFKRYDNWGKIGGSYQFTPRNGDGYLDMLYIIYRNAENLSNWFTTGGLYTNFYGLASLGSSLNYITHDNVIIKGGTDSFGSGITIRMGAGYYDPDNLTGYFSFLTNIMCHELGHYLLGGHTDIGGIMARDSETRTGALGSWERERLGYIGFTTPDQDNYTISLTDYVTNGQVLKIPIEGTAIDYFLVENHQRLNKYDQIMRGGSLGGRFDTTTTEGKGIYIWLIKNGNSWSPTVDIKTANGNWNWTYDGDFYAGPGWNVGKPYEGYLPKIKRSSVNRDGSGKSDRRARVNWNGEWFYKWIDINPLTKEWEISRNVFGIKEHAFNVDQTTLLTPWSSPSSYADKKTNISIQVFSEYQGSITLKVFNTESSAKTLPPSKPQFLRATIINGSANLIWELNQEPDVISGGKYKIYRAITNGNEPTSWANVATVNHPTTNWTDYDLYFGSNGNKKAFYCISAVDSTNKESMKSEYDWLPYNNLLQKDNSSTESKLEYYEYNLFNNYPNPFNPTTQISYEIKESGYVQLKVYNSLGEEVAELVNELKSVGKHQVKFNAENLPSGVYIYMIKVNEYVKNNKMLLIR